MAFKRNDRVKVTSKNTRYHDCVGMVQTVAGRMYMVKMDEDGSAVCFEDKDLEAMKPCTQSFTLTLSGNKFSGEYKEEGATVRKEVDELRCGDVRKDFKEFATSILADIQSGAMNHAIKAEAADAKKDKAKPDNSRSEAEKAIADLIEEIFGVRTDET